MVIDENNDGWFAWRNFVLAAIKENASNIEKLEIVFTNVQVDIGKLKLISLILGGVAGVVGTLLVMIVYKAVIL